MVNKLTGATPPRVPASEGSPSRSGPSAATPAPAETFTPSVKEWEPAAKPSFDEQLTAEVAQVKQMAIRTAGHAKSMVAALAIGLGVSLNGGCATAGALHGPIQEGLNPQSNGAYDTGRKIHDTVKPLIEKGIERAQPALAQGKEIGQQVGHQAVELTHQAGQFFKGLFGKP